MKLMAAIAIGSVMVFACGDDAPCPTGLIQRGPGVCKVPSEAEGGHPAADGGGNVADQPGGILPPVGGRGGAGGMMLKAEAGKGGNGGAGGKPVAGSGGSGSPAMAGAAGKPMMSMPDPDAGMPEPRCGDGKIDRTIGEVCDGDCPTACKQQGCMVGKLIGKSSTCDARCEYTALTLSRSGDDCCIGTTLHRVDSDCLAECMVDGDCGVSDECHEVSCSSFKCAESVKAGASCQVNGTCQQDGTCKMPSASTGYYTQCNSDADCKVGECVEGLCTKDCSAKGDCPTSPVAALTADCLLAGGQSPGVCVLSGCAGEYVSNCPNQLGCGDVGGPDRICRPIPCGSGLPACASGTSCVNGRCYAA